MPQPWTILKHLRCASPSGHFFFMQCRVCGQQPTQPVGELVSPSAQFADFKRYICVTCIREFSVVQSADFLGGSYVSDIEISMTSTVKCTSTRRDMKLMHQESWSLDFEEKGEEHRKGG
ncbi:uncharacterized protein BDCG_07350 [Blastomyces dermatitidis ER-3]|uniref:Uncharacterized protein n=1 Tax=Ajellomyces dermatitidis (strain ER-3 / ATCC MYA-2586) TaxID=559297 RepID=A0ABP2F5D3_AJEDR|nr:uncharacterized protein BDCG_07350 [Blastomyces dermatitidis ER-3]EEQ92230.1 hypothetical protein BDCG_07350 [Blastomyces dermatitidis ER-3]